MYRVTYCKNNGVEGAFECSSESRLTAFLNWLVDESVRWFNVSNLGDGPEPHWFY